VIRIRVLVALGLLALSGCIGVGFDLTDLPADPVAFVYRTREESERRVELLQRSKESDLQRSNTERYESSSFRLEAAAEYVGLGRSQEQKAADLLGRMATLDAHTETVTPFEFGFRGDRPLDWSDDRKRLLFASLRSASVQLYEWDRETDQVKAMSIGPDDHSTGCYLGDGRLATAGITRKGDVVERREIPDARERSRRPEKKRVSRIFLTAPGGGHERPLTDGPSDGKPACSPDGKTIVYETYDETGSPSLAMVTVDGGAPRIVARGRDADFTPDGTFVVYSAKTRAGWRLYQMHPDGQAKRPLGSGPERDENDPRVSPDGKYVIYVADDETRQQLRVRTIDGRKDRPLIWNGDGITPVW
jgi:dipeptidyl aminopeptidase/acylaminoacyl peptidase